MTERLNITEASALARLRSAVKEAVGTAPHLPSGAEYVGNCAAPKAHAGPRSTGAAEPLILFDTSVLVGVLRGSASAARWLGTLD